MGMFTISIRDSFSAAHRLEHVQGKCEALHGHNFMVEVSVVGDKLNNDGMLVDFQILKKYLGEVLDSLDHSYINDKSFFKERAGSSEYIAMYIFHELKLRIKEKTFSLHEVKVWESEKSWASYRE